MKVPMSEKLGHVVVDFTLIIRKLRRVDDVFLVS